MTELDRLRELMKLYGKLSLLDVMDRLRVAETALESVRTAAWPHVQPIAASGVPSPRDRPTREATLKAIDDLASDALEAIRGGR